MGLIAPSIFETGWKVNTFCAELLPAFEKRIYFPVSNIEGVMTLTKRQKKMVFSSRKIPPSDVFIKDFLRKYQFFDDSWSS